MSDSGPPLGVMPRRLWIESRFWDLTEACNRYMEADKEIPREWVDEMRQLFRAVNINGDDENVQKWKEWLGIK